jgi:hypothetical protein
VWDPDDEADGVLLALQHSGEREMQTEGEVSIAENGGVGVWEMTFDEWTHCISRVTDRYVEGDFARLTTNHTNNPHARGSISEFIHFRLKRGEGRVRPPQQFRRHRIGRVAR